MSENTVGQKLFFNQSALSGEVELLKPQSTAMEPKLLPGFYELSFHRTMFGIHIDLKRTNAFETQPEVYGTEIAENNQTWLNVVNDKTFMENNNLGILLYGKGGAGKSLQAHEFARHIVRNRPDIPVFLMKGSSSFDYQDAFEKFIHDTNMKAFFLYDEFDKTLDNMGDKDEAIRRQNSMLSLFSGGGVSGNVFMFVANEIERVSPYMRDARPGRIRYVLKYSGMRRGFIAAYINRHVINPDHRYGALNLAMALKQPTMDQLNAIASEINIQGKTATEIYPTLNLGDLSPQGCRASVVMMPENRTLFNDASVSKYRDGTCMVARSSVWCLDYPTWGFPTARQYDAFAAAIGSTHYNVEGTGFHIAQRLYSIVSGGEYYLCPFRTGSFKRVDRAELNDHHRDFRNSEVDILRNKLIVTAKEMRTRASQYIAKAKPILEELIALDAEGKATLLNDRERFEFAQHWLETNLSLADALLEGSVEGRTDDYFLPQLSYTAVRAFDMPFWIDSESVQFSRENLQSYDAETGVAVYEVEQPGGNFMIITTKPSTDGIGEKSEFCFD